jgi:hypothetical protein
MSWALWSQTANFYRVNLWRKENLGSRVVVPVAVRRYLASLLFSLCLADFPFSYAHSSRHQSEQLSKTRQSSMDIESHPAGL